jgi:hypothetical protein
MLLYNTLGRFHYANDDKEKFLSTNTPTYQNVRILSVPFVFDCIKCRDLFFDKKIMTIMKSKISVDFCSICFNDFTKNKDNIENSEGEVIVYVTDCNHLFHKDCLIDWLRGNSTILKCPMCRRVVDLIQTTGEKRFNLKKFCECDLDETIVPPPSAQTYPQPYRQPYPRSYPNDDPNWWHGGTCRRYKQKSHRRRGNSKKNRKRKSKKYLKKN